MSVVETGGAGFIGSHLVRALLQRPDIDNIIVLDNFIRGTRARLNDVLTHPRLAIINGDIRHTDVVEKAFDGASLVFHLAAQSNVMESVLDSTTCFSTNVQGTFNVFNAAMKQGVRRVVFTSSREVYGEPTELPVAETVPLLAQNEYGASKIAGETYYRLYRSKIEIAVLRLSNVYGPHDDGRVIPTFINRALQNLPIELYGGQQIIDFVWVGQVVAALLKVGFADNVPSDPVNIASGQGTSLRDLAERIKALIESDCAINILQPRRPEVVRFVAEISRMKSWLGLTPDADPLAHLPEVIEHYRLRQVEKPMINL